MSDRGEKLRSRWLQRAAGYSSVGAIGTACHYALLVLLTSGAHVPAAIAAGIGAFAGALVNYFLNHRLVFRSDRAHAETLPRFMLVALFGIGLNVAVVALLTHGFGVHYLLAQLAATGVVLLTGFILHHRWTFNP